MRFLPLLPGLFGRFFHSMILKNKDANIAYHKGNCLEECEKENDLFA
jgi:hypothetical protein